MHRITKGLDLPISGVPEPSIVQGPLVTQVGVVGADYVGMKPSMLVQAGDRVKLGQPLFADKKTEGVVFTAPAAGRVIEVNRGDRRAFQSVNIEIDGDDAVEFPKLGEKLDTASREEVTSLLVESGMWTSLRTRPFSKTPVPGSTPRSIFVQAIDTNPLAPNPMPFIRENERAFEVGVIALSKLTDGAVFVCRPTAIALPGDSVQGVQRAEFEGPHPAGLPGTHIHLLDPVGPGKVVWHINYQDVIAIGQLMLTGRLFVDRIISLAGPGVQAPRTVRTRLGASVTQLVDGGLKDGRQRVISGNPLSGRAVVAPMDYLGRFHLQVSAVPEGDQREFLGWMSPGAGKFSVRRVFTSALDRAKRFAFTTSTEGSKRAMVPIGMYEQVMPLDIIPTFLLRALITGDTDQAQLLGALELDEEDLSLCTFVCPGKYEYGPVLRSRLQQIETEG
ncbi:MAG: Na(+)-translocating NADH-quinone reductase subunit A [Planctomycetaceae bacterium]|nr:Na(+)-translocating NADH-quinone reductase subunit A [Planctomycetaceae bacterium]